MRIDSVEGMTKAAPRPMTARATMTVSDELPKLATSVPTRKRSRPPWSVPLRPKRSPMVPAVNSIPANTSA